MKLHLRNKIDRPAIIYSILFFASYLPVNAQLKANFTATTLKGCVPLTVNFQDLSTGAPTAWQWDLGNGSISKNQNPSTAYFNAGTYTVKLKISSASGKDSVIKVGFITVLANPGADFSVSKTTGCFPLRVNFSDKSVAGSGSLSQWYWDLGDGNISTDENPAHAYTVSGNYSVTLKVTNNNGCTKVISKTQYIQVTDGVIPNFENSTPERCHAPETISFSNLSTGPSQLSYQWSFGDGGVSNEVDPKHIYAAGGQYSVRLIVNSTAGCTDTLYKQDSILIRNYQTDFTTPDSVCLGGTSILKNNSSPAPLSFYWDVADSSFTTLDVTKTWTVPAVYNVKLVNNYGVCKDSVTKKVNVVAPPSINFHASDSLNCKAPFTTQFTDLTNGSVNWSWNFGDGTASTDKNPSHTYTTINNYTVSLTVTNGAGCTSSATKKSYIKIAAPKAAIPGLPAGGCNPFTYKASANIINAKGVASYLWDFGDGITATTAQPQHTYSDTGKYDIKLYYTTNDGCSDSVISRPGVKVGTPTSVNFTSSTVSQCVAKDIQFTDQSIAADEWSWQFGDGSSSVQQNPTHAYEASGTYTVTLTAKSSGCGTNKTGTVTILPPTAKFAAVFDCIDKTHVSFADSSIQPQSWLWNFGDGNTSTEQNPTHIYSSLGNYTVTLSTSNGTCDNQKSATIKLVNEHADFNTPKDTVCKNAPIAFNVINSNKANITNYTFYFGDSSSTSSSTNSITHAYTQSGTYSVKLVITDINGCEDSITKTNYITAIGPVAAFTASTVTGCKGLNVLFTDNSTADNNHPISNWQWNYGDSVIENLNAPPFTHTFYKNGSFNVLLKITDAIGCFDTASIDKPVVINSPVADFDSPDTLACIGSNVGFKSISQGDNLVYAWQLGNDNVATSDSVNTSYPSIGLYSVKLTVTDYRGCTDSIERSNFIRISIPKSGFNINDSIGSCSPFEVIFTNTSQNYRGLKWDFGDGSASSLKDPIHYYSIPGKYTATLYATLPGGCVDSFKRNIILYSSNAVFSYKPLSGCSQVKVDFKVTTESVLNYFWDFGDGNTIETQDSSISYTYLSAGDFKPKVILTNLKGCQIPLTGDNVIHVTKSIVNFGSPDSFSCFKKTITLTDSTKSNSVIKTYNWNFGDGNFSASQQPSHVYANRGNYSVRLIVTTTDGCSDTLTKNNYVHVYGPSATIVGNTTICINDFLSLTGNWTNPDSSVIAWHWKFGNGNTSLLQDPPKQIYPSAGSFPLQMIIYNTNGCADTTNTLVTVNPLPATSAGKDAIVCLNNKITLQPTGADSYSWFPSLYLSCSSCEDPIATPADNITYYVTGKNAYGCITTDSVSITVKKPIKLTVTPISDSICQGSSVNLSADGADIYNWYPSASLNNTFINDPIATPMENTVYKVIGTDDAHCFSDSASVTIAVSAYPVVNAGQDKNISFGATTSLTPVYSGDIVSWQWSPAAGLSCADCPNPVAMPQTSTNYSVTVTNRAGCSVKDDVAVNYPCQVSIFIPNTFSPNNDGMNDYFYPRGKDIYLIQSMRIFNRWGQMVFQRTNFSANSATMGWDGRFNGQQASTDVYTYVIEVICNNNYISTFRGDIALIR
ncbi:PKD domain-containing protein [Ferruginibacter albus]|uniref:PKD domain-containing protein n=1 Tax=Ferruginibacter albus TaxID=2875540 RepID=UPI001CC5CC72|nr:PKD domain-containing protein [Ferruginibacter albus]UAY50636.1 PKD domain-containing protein [Ferruginibacter albus]